MGDTDTDTVRNYYNETVEYEWTRIDGRPEFLLACRFIDRYVKPGHRVLDIGGGPGRYSLRLAGKGCNVTLLDLSSANVAFAKAKAAELGLSITAVEGDAREADRIVQGPFDHVLLMGPMYHLLEEADRAAAVQASLNLLKPGGTIFVSFCSMMGGISWAMSDEPSYLFEHKGDAYLTAFLDGKSFAGDMFTRAFFIQQREILPFMERFPLEKLHLFGQEGLMLPCEDKILAQPPEVVEEWLDMSEKMCENEDYLSYSAHLVYVGRKW